MSSHTIIFSLVCAVLIDHVSLFSFGQWGVPEQRVNENSLKETFLAKLGLNHEPNVTRAKITEEQMEELMDVYERSMKDDDDISSSDNTNFQRLYSYKDNAPKTGKRDVHLISFDLNIGNAARGLQIHSAKLHIFKEQKRSRRDSLGTVELYQLLDSSRYESPESLLIESRRVSFSANEWEVFDVTRAVATWLENPSTNHGFLVKCKECSRKRVTLVTADTATDPNKRSRLDVSVVDSDSSIKRRRSNPFIRESEEEYLNDCTKGSENNLCCRYSLWISFKEMGWDWIVKPEGFHAYYCKGECPYDYINYANTHALLQSIYNTKYDKKIPPPCCVPKSLKPLSLLHYSDSDPPQLVVSRQMGMIAESCGCA